MKFLVQLLDPLRNSCSCSQETIPDDETDLDEIEDQSVFTNYKPGAILLGKVPGYPWYVHKSISLQYTF